VADDAADLDGAGEGEAALSELRAYRCRECAHVVKDLGCLVVEGTQELVAAVARVAEIGNERIDFGGEEGVEVGHARPPRGGRAPRSPLRKTSPGRRLRPGRWTSSRTSQPAAKAMAGRPWNTDTVPGGWGSS